MPPCPFIDVSKYTKNHAFVPNLQWKNSLCNAEPMFCISCSQPHGDQERANFKKWLLLIACFEVYNILSFYLRIEQDDLLLAAR